MNEEFREGLELLVRDITERMEIIEHTLGRVIVGDFSADTAIHDIAEQTVIVCERLRLAYWQLRPRISIPD